MSKNPARNYAVEYLLRKAGAPTSQITAIASAIVTTVTEALGETSGDVSGSLPGPLQVVGLGGSRLTLPWEDRRVPLYDLVSDSFLNGAFEDLGTRETDATLVASPDGSGGILFRAETGGGFGLPWFIPEDHGAAGDGTTDDTTAYNATVAALNAAGRGVLYLPSRYKLTATPTSVAVPATIMGDGMGELDASSYVSALICTSQTAVALPITAEYAKVKDLAILNTYAGTPTSASAGIKVSGGSVFQRVDYDAVLTSGFYINIDVQVGCQWTMRGCHNWSPVKYGVKVQNTVNGDFGDWAISDSSFYPYNYNADAAIRWESSGGGKVIGCKFNSGGTSKFVRHIDASFSGLTSVALIAACSFENYSGDAIHLDGGGSGFSLATITTCQFGQYGNSTGRGIYTTAVSDITISNLTGKANTGTPTFISLNSGSIGRVSSIANDGFGTVLSTSSFTSLIDGTGGVAGGVAITGTPSSGDVPIATSGTAAAWGAGSGVGKAFDATLPAAIGTAAVGAAATVPHRDHVHATGAGTPTTSAIGDAAATGAGPAAAMTDHVHGREALSTATPLVESGAGAVGTATKNSREDHVHPAAATSTATSVDSVPVFNIQFNGDGVTTAFELPAAPFDAYSVIASVAGVIQDVTLSGTMLTTMTFGSAPASGTGNVRADIIAAAA